jgi:hypothetical protein
MGCSGAVRADSVRPPMARLRAYVARHHWGMIATFLVLTGGTAYAVNGPLAGTNTVGSADIINGEVHAPDIKAGAVSAAKVACPQGTVRTVGLCMDKASRNSSANIYSDMNVCANRGRRLASFAELHGALHEGKVDPVPPAPGAGGSAEWTSDIYVHDGTGFTFMLLATDATHTAQETSITSPGIGFLHFRCVTGP